MSKRISLDFQEQNIQHGQTTHDKGTKSSSNKWYTRQDAWLWFSGLVFCAALIGAMMGMGYARGWDAWSGLTHNETQTSQERFLPEPEHQEPHIRGRSGPDLQGRWYYWKLKPQKVTPYSRLFAWFGYLSHQFLIWGVIYRAQLQKAMEPLGKPKYSTEVNTFNWVAFGLNAFFHVLHLINTHTTYDGLAQDVAIVSSQGSVILLLNVIILMEYKDRGLFFGWPSSVNGDKISRKLRLNLAPVYLVRKYHGYAFAWGAIYTFWYHPMENTIGHALGFIYTWLLVLQGSLMYTKFHDNAYWKLFLEIYVIIHGSLVAWQTGGKLSTNTTLWPMFLFGFALVFVLTQIFSLPFWKKIPWWTRILPLLPVIGVMIWCYSWIKDDNGRPWVRLAEVVRIPGFYYIYTLITWLLIYVFVTIERLCRGDSANEPAKTATGRLLSLMAGLSIFGIGTGISIAIELGDVKIPFTIQMFMFITVFVLCAAISVMFLKQSVPRKRVLRNLADTVGEKNGDVFHVTDAVDITATKAHVNKAFLDDKQNALEQCSTPF